MMLAAFIFLLHVTGGRTTSNYTEQPELPGDQQMFSFEESGSTSSYTEQPEVNGESSKGNCTYRDVLNHLNLKENENFMTLPGGVKSPTKVKLDLLLYAILDVNEKDQQFVSYIWIDVTWMDDNLSWNPTQFCDIWDMYLPAEKVWKPDLTIEEMDDMLVVSTCTMEVYRFPFDFQKCTLSFKSIIHSDRQIMLIPETESSRNTKLSKEMMRTQSEWLFIDMKIDEKTVDNFGVTQSMLVYTITMKRRSALYVINFLVPILLFLFLDLASFLISDSGGEKLGFKVTVLLAVTVMQLILNDILPSSSDKIPLIAVYCIGMFGLMMLSLMETILVMHLMEKDSKDQSLSKDCGDKQGKVSFQNCCREVKKLTHFCHICDMSPGETPSGLLPVAKEGSSSHLAEKSHASDELSEAVKTLTLLLSNREEERKPDYWTRVSKTINKVFFIFYVITASVFLLCLFFNW
ncbi:5-hydroxytryptamine receptor 3A isoform X2 [Etheostoma spectabile]|uniref:5-hydroxytryptamine receptor 3A isoform X2 n=1 Tax=Etheostoma spectabile TaxID=54343 RepID=UPI0013AFE6CF|nr:5-hydroxytryptamine receptor 3A-like isoform X2 [Etheostoma spectabile]